MKTAQVLTMCSVFLGASLTYAAQTNDPIAGSNVALLTMGATAKSSGDFPWAGVNYPASNAIDGNDSSEWGPAGDASGSRWLEISLAATYWISRIRFVDDQVNPGTYVRTGYIDYYEGTNWIRLLEVNKTSPGFDQTFSPVQTSKVRFTITASSVPGSWINQNANIAAFEIYGTTQSVILQQPQDQQVPVGGTAVFTVQTLAGYSYSYQWYFNSTAISRETNQSLTISSARFGDTGSYFVEVRYGSSVIRSDSAVLSVEEFMATIYPAVEITFPSSVGKNYQIQSSDDLASWFDFGPIYKGTGQVIDALLSTRNAGTGTLSMAPRFFRITEK